MEKNKIAKLLIIILLTVIAVFAGIIVAKKINDKSEKQGIKTEKTNSDKNNNNSVDIDSNISEELKNKITQEAFYYWQNPNEEYAEYIFMGMQGATIKFNVDNTITIDGGNGNWYEGTFEVKNNIVECTIEKYNSTWHLEPEILDDTAQFKLEYTKLSDTLEVISISKTKLTIHVIDMVTGELTEETKEYSLEQLAIGNIYSSENIYEEIY